MRYKIHKISLIYIPGGMRAEASGRWFHHGGTINGAIRYVLRERRRPGCPGERTFDFSLSFSLSRGERGESEERKEVEDAGRARVHFPCTHTPSTIRRPLAAPTWNAIPPTEGEREEANGGRERGGERIKCRSVEAGGAGGGINGWTGYPERKERR